MSLPAPPDISLTAGVSLLACAILSFCLQEYHPELVGTAGQPMALEKSGRDPKHFHIPQTTHVVVWDVGEGAQAVAEAEGL